MAIEKIVVVDDEMMIRKSLETQLRNKRYSVASAKDLKGARKILSRDAFDLVFLDMRLPDGDGMELLEELAVKADSPMVVMMTGFGSVESAVACMQAGAFDYVLKPFSFDQVEVVVDRAASFDKMKLVNRYYVEEEGSTASEIIGQSPAIKHLKEMVLKVAKTEITVMDMNETRLQFCKEKLGVDHTVVFKNDGKEVDRLREVNGGESPITVIDATGSHVSMSNAFQYASFTGQVLYVGITTQELSFKHVTIHRPELTIKASRNAVPADFKRIISLIEDGVIDTDPWLSHQASYDDFIDEFPNWLKPETGVIKAVLYMN